jgi:para-nitrobenzyl esterase
MTHRRNGSAVATLVVALSLMSVLARAQTVSGAGDARVDGGLVRGSASASDARVRVYRGVPYAAPPVGPLRWRPPSAVQPWEGVREASSFAPPCAQTERPGEGGAPGGAPGGAQDGVSPPAVIGSENCLYLNLWSGAAPGARRPVLVWIHGGGMRRGSASDPARDGTALAARGLVVVSVAYRLGSLGFFSHPLLSAESEHRSSGGYGVLDQIAALQWIARNVEEFGGDPSRVTVFGQSGGARAVNYLQSTPLARGLFHRAIAHSGANFDEQVYLRDPPSGGVSAEAAGERWVEAMLGRAGAPAAESADPGGTVGDLLGALRELPFEQVVERVEALFAHYSVPVDGWILPDTPYRLFAAGRQTDVPVLIGWNANEAMNMAGAAGAPADAAAYARRVVEEYGDDAPAFEKHFPPGDDPRAAFLRGHGVQTFGWNMWTWARSMRTAQSPAFYYHFERGPSTPGSGATARHGAELPYVFGILGAAKAPAQADRERAALMMDYWTAFVATGDPNGGGRPCWPRYTENGDETMVFGDAVEARSGVRKEDLEFFTRYFDRLRVRPAGAGSLP